jgi:hypothetical protein
VELAAPDWLDRDVIACLEEKCGTLVDAVLIAYASASVGGELDSLGVRNLSSFGGADVYVPEGRERVVWARVVEYHGCEAHPAAEFADVEPDLSGKPLPAVAVLRALRASTSGRSIRQVGRDEDIDLRVPWSSPRLLLGRQRRCLVGPDAAEGAGRGRLFAAPGRHESRADVAARWGLIRSDPVLIRFG